MRSKTDSSADSYAVQSETSFYTSAPAPIGDQAAAIAQAKLDPAETLLWAGRPKQGLILRSNDILLIPFSLLWGGFALFWEGSALFDRGGLFLNLWGIPFALVGLYMIVGRFFLDAFLRSRTYYAVTNERVLIISGLLNQNVKSLNLRILSEMTVNEKGDKTGTLTFGHDSGQAWFMRGMEWPGVSQQRAPQFEGVRNVKQVYDIIRQVQLGMKP